MSPGSPLIRISELGQQHLNDLRIYSGGKPSKGERILFQLERAWPGGVWEHRLGEGIYWRREEKYSTIAGLFKKEFIEEYANV